MILPDNAAGSLADKISTVTSRQRGRGHGFSGLLVTLPSLLAAEIGLRDAESRNAKDKLARIAVLLVKRVGRYACIGLGAHA
jgi:hypothetical protein